ncbi:MAG: proton-conducting transporter membrane subunit [Humidesulfovibrio sp.]|nr:proton-conducting transporter membrane subunit [Humidesulfovibrio sp.]
MLDAYIGVLVLWPLVAGLACLVLKSPGVRSALVLSTGAALAVGALGVASQVPMTANPGFLSSQTALYIAEGAAFALPIYFLIRGLMEKHVLVIVFAIAQLGLAAMSVFGLAAPAAAKSAVYCDGLSLALVLVVSLVGSLICIFALPYMKHHEEHLHLKVTRQPGFFLILLAFLGFMNGLALSNDLRVFAAFYEATTLCSFLLIGHDKTEESKKSAFRALWMNCMGGVFLHGGIVLIQKQFGMADIHELMNPTLWAGASMLPIALLALAGCVKAAQMPFQSWLLGAMVAPTPVSALLHSSTMVKVGVFVCLRLGPVLESTTTGRVLALVGAFTFFATSALALGQSNAKKILAYSTIANLGLIIACAGIGTPIALAAGVVLLAIHAVTKGLLFLCVGDMEQTVGSRDLEDLRGLISKSPVTALAASAGAMAMILPPLGMLVGKWAALEAAAASPIAMVLIALGSALGVVCWVRFAGTLMSGQSIEAKTTHTSALTSTPILAMLAGAVGLGMAAPWFNALLLPASNIATALAGGWGLLPGLFIVAMLAWIIGMKVLGRQSAATLATPYIGGLPSVLKGTYVGPLGRNWTLTEGNEYASEIFGESKLTKFAGALAGALLLALVGGAII